MRSNRNGITKGREGIEERHTRSCASRSDRKCDCEPRFQATVSMGRGKRVRKNFATITAAKLWRDEAKVAAKRGALAEPSKLRLREAADRWVKGAESGAVLTRSGERYK